MLPAKKFARATFLVVFTYMLSQLRLFSIPEAYRDCPGLSTHKKVFEWVTSSQLSLEAVQSFHKSVSQGRWRPLSCIATLRLAVMIPYRNRQTQLSNFLLHMHRYFQLHNYDYLIAVIEQTDSSPFNRGMLLNVGFREINRLFPNYYNCFALHDVDIMPVNTTISYQCPTGISVAHLASNTDRFQYKTPYAWYLGGISVIDKKTYEALNGFSNLYFGWGGEDDDMAYRLKARGGRIIRYDWAKTMTSMMNHSREKENFRRQSILENWRYRTAVDGLNSLDYNLTNTAFNKLFLHLTVDINQTTIINDYMNKYHMTVVPPTSPPFFGNDLKLWDRLIGDLEDSSIVGLSDKTLKDLYDKISKQKNQTVGKLPALHNRLAKIL